uniref:dnaJ homolog subfamily B member 9-like isoform X1 n=1 Tax=Doryrhamphus excisus TaxID=161450 RepID=UPI0025AE107E|nr:dnaJ homolog subfamily B member 9-like isoform X1 [Doryrhamphus excisus]
MKQLVKTNKQNMTVRPCLVLLLLFLLLSQAVISKSYYETLNVEQTASERQIKKAYRKLALKYHPDKTRSADAETIFREIVEAYTLLCDTEKRRLYDKLGHDGFLSNNVLLESVNEDESGCLFCFGDLEDIFTDSFTEELHFYED